MTENEVREKVEKIKEEMKAIELATSRAMSGVSRETARIVLEILQSKKHDFKFIEEMFESISLGASSCAMFLEKFDMFSGFEIIKELNKRTLESDSKKVIELRKRWADLWDSIEKDDADSPSSASHASEDQQTT